MKYLGGKAKLAKEIIKTIGNFLNISIENNKLLLKNYNWVEPFCGASNVLQYVKSDASIIANDINSFIVSLYNISMNDPSWMLFLPENVDEDSYKHFYIDYKNVLDDKNRKILYWNFKSYFNYTPLDYRIASIGYIGSVSYGGKFFGGYSRSKNSRNYYSESKNKLIKQILSIKENGKVLYNNYPYNQLRISKNSIIYCDPPYANTTGYNENNLYLNGNEDIKFNSAEFWKWANDQYKNGNKYIFVSEFEAPNEWISIWKKDRFKVVNKPYRICQENLFIRKELYNEIFGFKS